ncbi:MAG TPA: tripartite tricarboxylate transporter substrate binding protein [Xanthobacteraceae bacterium]
MNDPARRQRRQFLHLIAGAATFPAVPRVARAQAYPSRPVTLVVGFAAGGGNDIVGRLIGQWLSERLGQPFIIENRPGAGTNIAAEMVIRAAPDGYTLLLAGLPNASNATLYANLKLDFIRDTVPIAGVARSPHVLVANPSFPARTVPELIAYAKANPGKVNMASAGTGSGGHLAGELFKSVAGVDLTHVPFRGNGPALTALLGSQVDITFATPPSSIEYIRTGKLFALAVTSTTRLDALPDAATVSESLPGFETQVWYGVVAPRGTPAEVIDKINKEINASLADPKLKARLADLGDFPFTLSNAEFGRLIVDETEKWGKIIRAASIKLD